VVVIVNDVPVTLSELEGTPEFYDFLEEYVTAKMVQTAANEQGLSPTREAVDGAERAEIQERFAGDREALTEWLAERGLTEDDFRKFVVRKLRQEMLIARHLEPSDEEVRAVFNSDKEYLREQYAELFRIPKDQVKDDLILGNLKKNLTYLRRNNPAETRKILATYRGWATRVVYPRGKAYRPKSARKEGTGGLEKATESYEGNAPGNGGRGGG
jgi:hypothetical protein